VTNILNVLKIPDHSGRTTDTMIMILSKTKILLSFNEIMSSMSKLKNIKTKTIKSTDTIKYNLEDR
jgi:hypothetical protein